MNSVYLNASSSSAKVARRKSARAVLFSFLALIFATMSVIGAYSPPQEASAEDNGGFIKRFACWFDEDTIPRKIYQTTQTSDMQFALLSKSAIGTAIDDVDGGLNKVMDYVNKSQGEQYTYEKRNERILGGAKLDEDDPGNPAQWNKGGEVLNPFDRFGVAGLRFSSYGGEWKHLFIDACANENLGSPSGGEVTLPNTPAGGLVVATTNIKNSENNNTVRGAIENVRSRMPVTPNVWLFQEATGAHAPELASSLGPGWEVYKDETKSWSEGNAVGWDTSVFSKVASGIETIYNPPADGPYETYKGETKTWKRWAAWVTLSDGTNTFSVISVHGKLGSAAKAKQWKNLIALQDRLSASGPVIAGGDFNDSSLVKSMQSAAGYQLGASANIDHFFHSSTTSATEGGVFDKPQTAPHMDHPAVWNSFALTGATGTITASTTVATFNILGAGHTGGGGDTKPGWPEWTVRLPKTFALLESSGVSVAGLQEVHAAQSNAIKSQSRYNSTWGMYPTDGSQNKVIWKKSDWTFVSGEKVNIPYFKGNETGMPIARLRHNTSGQELYFWSIHNPANVKGPAAALRKEGLDRQLAKVQATSDAPFILVGDFNDAKDGANMSHCVLTPTMTNAFGPGSTSPCRKPQGSAPIDHIYGTQTTFSGGQVSRTPGAQKISDHPLVTAAVSFGAGSSVVVTPDFLDPGAGDYYEGRLDPKSTWEDIPKSQDVRSQQFSKGLDARYKTAILTNLSNWIFLITKIIVVFTIALVGLAFSDIVGLLGVDSLLMGSGRGADRGVYGALYENLFGPLVIMAFLLTAGYMIWHGIVKRQYRDALGGLIRSVACFLIAVIVSVSPAWFIALPNNVAVVTQSIIASTLNRGLAGGSGLCASDVGVVYITDRGATSGNADVEKSEKLLKKASLNMQSTVGCAFWQTFLFKPWVEGQFGVSNYKELNGPQLGNRNGPYEYTGDERESKGWVGKPEVPLGKGRIVDNWALFQLSTQTNAHSPVDKNGELAEESQGVAQDWWRAVDAFSNYQEDSEIKSKVQGFGGAYGEVKTITYAGPMEPQVLDEWDAWSGNAQGHRLVTALSSVLIAGIGVAAPAIFATLAALYAIGIAILMSFAPIMFLFGCWAGRGWEIFKAWGDLVITTTIKRIVLGVLMVVSLIFTSVALRLMNSLGYWQGLLIMIILSIALVKSRHKLFQALSFIRFSSVDFGATASKVSKTFGTAAGGVGKFGTAAAGGAIQGKRYGGSFAGGALAGMKQEFTNLSYRSPELRRSMQAYSAQRMNDEDSSEWANRQCAICSKFLNQTGVYESDEFGYVCEECVDDGRVEDATFIGYHYGLDENRIGRKSVYETSQELTAARNAVASTTTARETTKSPEEEVILERVAEVQKLAMATASEVARYKAEVRVKERLGDLGGTEAVKRPQTPAEIAPFLDQRALEVAWESENEDYIKLAYTTGWIEWARAQDPELAKALDGKKASDIYYATQNDTGADWYRHTMKS